MYSSGSKPLPEKWERRMCWEVAIEIAVFVAHAVLFLIFFLSFPALAAGVEVVETVRTSAPLISDQVALLLGLAAGGAIASAAASAWNAYLRSLKKQGRRVGPLGLAFGAFLNGIALNFDQAARQASAARGLKP